MTDAKPASQEAPHLKALNDYNQRLADDLHKIANYFKQHPTLGISLLYLSFSTFGLLYTNLLFGQFDVNIMLHLEVTDFMLAGFHHPLSIAICIGFVALLWAVNAIDVKLKRLKFYYRFSERINGSFLSTPPLANISMLGCLAVFAGTDIAAEREAELYVNQHVQAYKLQLTEPFLNEGIKTDRFIKVQVISDTVKFLWIREPATNKVFAIPQEYVSALTPIIVGAPEQPESKHTPDEKAETVPAT